MLGDRLAFFKSLRRDVSSTLFRSTKEKGEDERCC